VKVSTAFVDFGLLKDNNATVANANAEERMIFFIFVVLNFLKFAECSCLTK
jgi:hypothetical protein